MVAQQSANLGRMLFSRQGNPVAGVIVIIIGVFLGAGIMVGAVASGEAVTGILMGAMIAAIVVLGGVILMKYSASVHEHGIRVQRLGEDVIRFDQLRTFSYASVYNALRMFDISLTLIPREGKQVMLDVNPRWGLTNDKEVTQLRDRLAAQIAQDMDRELDRRRSVEWIAPAGSALARRPALSLTRDGCVVHESKGDQRFRFRELQASIAKGFFTLVRADSKKQVYSCPCSAENFYPGLELMGKLAGTK